MTTRRRSEAIIGRMRATYRRTRPDCAICGKPINYEAARDHPDSLNVDHIVPFSKGGADAPHNYQPAHRGCNSTKRARKHAPIIKRSGALD